MADVLSYCHCNPKVTCVVEANIGVVWQIVRQWSTFYFLSDVAGNTCEVKLYEGQENMIGSVRSVAIGHTLMFERLVAVDDETHVLKWRVINHPDSVTPFAEASYINALLTLSLREVTHNDHTFAQWEAEFLTEQEHAEDMYRQMESWIIGALTDVQNHVHTPNPTVNQKASPPKLPAHPIQPQYAAEHVAKFADLHINNSAAGHYPPPPQTDPYMHARKDIQGGRTGNAVVMQSGKPMGNNPYQGYAGQQSWPDVQGQPMHPSIPPMRHSLSQDPMQPGELRPKPRHHPIGGLHGSESGSNRESMDRHDIRSSRQSRGQRPTAMTHGGGLEYDPRSRRHPMAAAAMQREYDPRVAYDPQMAAFDYYSDTRSRTSSRSKYPG